MSDLLKGLAGGGWPFMVAWVLPSSIAVALLALAVLPAIDHLPIARELAQLETTQAAVAAGFAAVALGVVMSQVQVLLYRVLEGYILWPEALRKRRTRAMIRRIESMQKSVEGSASGVERQLKLEGLRQFPRSKEHVAPTRFGNALRALEVYGYDRYNLDSQALWAELTACAPEPLPEEYASARAGVDFFVSMLWLSAVVGLSALAVGVAYSENRSTALAIGVIALGVVPVWWYSGIKSVDHWQSVVQAIVNLGRKPLAEALGLRLPSRIDEERQMWRLVNWCVYYPFDEGLAKRLEDFRVPDPRSGAGGAADPGASPTPTGPAM